MASIPLPALAVNTQQASPLDQYGKALSLQNLMRNAQYQQQAQPLELEKQQQENEQRALQLKDQQTLRSLAQQHTQKDEKGQVTGFDFDGLVKDASAAGVSPTLLTQMQSQRAEAIKNFASADEATRNNAMAKNKAMYEGLESLKALPPEQRQAQLPNLLQNLQKQGVDVSKIPPNSPLDDASLNSFEAGLGMHAQVLADAKTAAETAEKQQQTATAKATQAHTEMETAQGGPPSTRAMNDWLAKNPGKGPSDYEEHMKKIVPAFNFSLQQGGVGTAPLNPSQQATAQAIIEGRMSPPGSFALKTPYWQQVMGNVFQQDPEWSEQRAQLRKDFTVGKHSTEINAINTAMGHVGVLGDAIDALDNKNVQVLNRIANNLGAQVGQTPQTTFNTIVHRVGPEIAKAYLGAGGSAGERGADEKDFDPALGPSQLKSNVGMTAKLLRSKIGALENQWNQNKSESMPSFQDRFITPEAKAQLDKWSPQKGGNGGLQIGQTVGVKGKQMKITAIHPDGSFDAE